MKLLLLLFLSSTAYSFPDLALNHGYTSCSTCHVNEAGGGALTNYGRALSEEILSTWSYEGEGKALYLNMPSWLIVGGDIRSVYIATETSGTYIPMQKDVELGFKLKQITVTGSAGLYNDRELESRTHSFSFKPYDFMSYKYGKFIPAYGLKFPDHTAFNRSPLGLGEGDESYNHELALKSQYGEVFLTAIEREFSKGLSSRVSVFPMKEIILGASAMVIGEDLTYGGFFSAAYKGLFLASDINQTKEALYAYTRTSFELYKGVSVVYENNYSNTLGISSRSNSLGLGLYPRPHVELFGRYFIKDGLAGILGMIHYSL